VNGRITHAREGPLHVGAHRHEQRFLPGLHLRGVEPELVTAVGRDLDDDLANGRRRQVGGVNGLAAPLGAGTGIALYRRCGVARSTACTCHAIEQWLGRSACNHRIGHRIGVKLELIPGRVDAALERHALPLLDHVCCFVSGRMEVGRIGERNVVTEGVRSRSQICSGSSRSGVRVSPDSGYVVLPERCLDLG